MQIKIAIKRLTGLTAFVIHHIPNVSSGCSNSSILKCKCPFIRHSSRKCLFEIVGHALRILSEASISILQRWGQYVKGEWKWCPCDDFKIGRLFPPKISKKYLETSTHTIDP